MKLKNLLLVCSLFLAGGVVATSGEQANSVKAETKTYEKVTSNLADYSGEYLIVYETGKLIFNGSLTADQGQNRITGITITDKKITTDSKYSVTIAKSGTGYSIKTASGKYIGGKSGNNSLQYSASAYVNAISIENGNAKITNNNTYLKYNKNSGSSNERFRYYKTDSQEAIQLYRLADDDAGNVGGEETKVTADAFLAAVNAIPANPTLGDVAKVQTAREEYNKIKSEADLVASSAVVTALNKVVNAETAIAALVDEKILAIGTVDETKGELIAEARSAYNLLTNEMKTHVAKLDILEAAEEAIKEFSASQTFTESAKALLDGINKGAVTVKHTKGGSAATDDVPMRLYAQSKLDISIDTSMALGITSVEMDYESKEKPTVCTFSPNYVKNSVTGDLYTFDFAGAEKISITFGAQVRLDSFTVHYTPIKADDSAITELVNAIETITTDFTLEDTEMVALVNDCANRYSALEEDQKAKVTNYSKVTAALERIVFLNNDAAANVVESQIAALGEVTLDEYFVVDSVNKAFNELTDEQKALVENKSVLDTALVSAQELVADLKVINSNNNKVENTSTKLTSDSFGTTYDVPEGIVVELEETVVDDKTYTYTYGVKESYIKFGSAEKAGNLTLKATEGNYVKSVKIFAKNYNDEVASLLVNAGSLSLTQEITEEFAMYDFDLSSEISSELTIRNKERLYVQGIIVELAEIPAAPVVPENAEKFMESKVESALSLSYLYDGENYSNFSNLALLLRLRFDFEAYGEGVEESGLVITRSEENAEGFVAGSENVTSFKDENKDGEYVIKVEAGEDVASVLDTQLYVCGYVVVDGNTYVTTVYHVSFKSMLELYANSDHESAPVAAAALAYWTNAQ